MGCNQEEFGYGLIASGMSDGFINIWDPKELVNEE
jgi:hypothetical protein